MGVTTVVIEPRFLVREGLVSLLKENGYATIGSIDSAANAEKALDLAKAPRLVILGPLPAVEVATTTLRIRRLWPDAKIVLLCDEASSGDCSALLASEIDGCVPLFASPDSLVNALDRILQAGDFRVLIFKTDRCSSAPCSTGIQENAGASGLNQNAPIRSDEPSTDAVDGTSSVKKSHGLTPRQEAILVGLTKGHSNKMIARTCGISEATIKVHMKSVLQRLRLSNRTQAAVWAIDKGYGAGTQAAAA